MTPEDKNKLKKAFMAAIDESPYAAEVIEGLTQKDGKPVTRRDMVVSALVQDEFYASVAGIVAGGEKTLDEFIAESVKGLKLSLYGTP